MNRSNAFQGLTGEQRRRCKMELDARTIATADGRIREGWSLYRIPSTLNPPHTVRLLKRDANGRVVKVISISERA
jgi:hypothetical protein